MNIPFQFRGEIEQMGEGGTWIAQTFNSVLAAIGAVWDVEHTQDGTHKRVTLVAVTFAGLPSPPVEGMLASITDGSSATWGATVAGGGTNHVLVRYNGTNWTVVGK